MINAELEARRAKAVPRGVASATTIWAARANNSEIWDEDGRRYIDFAAGIAVLNLGHRHPRVLTAVQEQLERYSHTAFQVMAYEPYLRLAERLNALAPVNGDAKTIFFTTGAEATENAIKIARAATRRPGIIAFAGAFHGRTLLASALTGKVTPYKRGLGPFPSDIFHVPYPSATNGISLDETIRALDRLFQADLEPERFAAFIIEPVLGEGGFHRAMPELFPVLAQLRERHGILLIADEVQTGFGRTGKMFGIEHMDVQPDLIAVAKSLAGGFPLSGVTGRAEIMDVIDPGGLGGTYAGFPLACAAANAVLDILEEEDLFSRANEIGHIAQQRLLSLRDRRDMVKITNVRGLGAMVAFDVVDQDQGDDAGMAKHVCALALQSGLIVLTCGQLGNSIRLLAPLTISDELLSEGLDLLEQSLIAARPTGTSARETAARATA